MTSSIKNSQIAKSRRGLVLDIPASDEAQTLMIVPEKPILDLCKPVKRRYDHENQKLIFSFTGNETGGQVQGVMIDDDENHPFGMAAATRDDQTGRGYPDWRGRVVPPALPSIMGAGTAVYGTAVLKTLLAASRYASFHDKDCPIAIHTPAPREGTEAPPPSYVQFGDQRNVFGLCMPLSMAPHEAPPEWLALAETETDADMEAAE